MPSPTPCVPACCTTVQNVQIPGVEGLPGTNGTNGQNGIDAYTITTVAFAIPAVGSPVTVSVANSLWMAIGQVVIVGQGVGAVLANPGPMTAVVTALPSANSVQLTALGYPGDASGANIDSTAVVSPAGRAHSQAKVTYIFNGTTSFVPSSTSNLMFVECWGAGGSGGGCDGAANASAASGGGGGAYSAKFISGPLLASYACAVGAGGISPAAGANPGNDGGDTSFDGGTVLAKGGLGGGAGAAAGTTTSFIAGAYGGSGGSGAGDVKMGGGSGRMGFRSSGTVAFAGAGGAAGGGGGGSNPDIVAAGAGAAGIVYGGGGSGALSFNGSAVAAGGAGANALIKVTEWA